LLPKLRFLEVSEANDHAVAAMVSAPNLQQLIVREDYWSLTNEGFGHLVEKQVVGKPFKLSPRSRQESSTVQDSHQELSMVTLPSLAGNGKESDLQHMALGKK
jgi:hypothetical protein